MREGDVALAALPQADGLRKLRPVLLLRQMPGYGDFLVCGISTRLDRRAEGLDEVVRETDEDFDDSGLQTPSVICLSFLAVLSQSAFPGPIGRLSTQRHARLLDNLARYLLASTKGGH